MRSSSTLQQSEAIAAQLRWWRHEQERIPAEYTIRVADASAVMQDILRLTSGDAQFNNKVSVTDAADKDYMTVGKTGGVQGHMFQRYKFHLSNTAGAGVGQTV